MAIYAISDLHLSFGVNKPMNVFGEVWKDYEKRIEENWKNTVKDTDTVIIAGDVSWGITLKEALPDFKFINDLPGNKIMLKGNHDYYFSTKTKVENFFTENNLSTLQILHNNAIDTSEYIICGTRAWGKTENTNAQTDKGILIREQGRLRISLDKGKKLQDEYLEKGISKDIIVALHFPPFIENFQEIMQEYNVKKCIYGHLHGYGHNMIREGNINNIEYIMVSCDYTKFKLIKL